MEEKQTIENLTKKERKELKNRISSMTKQVNGKLREDKNKEVYSVEGNLQIRKITFIGKEVNVLDLDFGPYVKYDNAKYKGVVLDRIVNTFDADKNIVDIWDTKETKEFRELDLLIKPSKLSPNKFKKKTTKFDVKETEVFSKDGKLKVIVECNQYDVETGEDIVKTYKNELSGLDDTKQWAGYLEFMDETILAGVTLVIGHPVNEEDEFTVIALRLLKLLNL